MKEMLDNHLAEKLNSYNIETIYKHYFIINNTFMLKSLNAMNVSFETIS